MAEEFVKSVVATFLGTFLALSVFGAIGLYVLRGLVDDAVATVSETMSGGGTAGMLSGLVSGGAGGLLGQGGPMGQPTERDGPEPHPGGFLDEMKSAGDEAGYGIDFDDGRGDANDTDDNVE